MQTYRAACKARVVQRMMGPRAGSASAGRPKPLATGAGGRQAEQSFEC
jgi:hypothetical protein